MALEQLRSNGESPKGPRERDDGLDPRATRPPAGQGASALSPVCPREATGRVRVAGPACAEHAGRGPLCGPPDRPDPGACAQREDAEEPALCGAPAPAPALGPARGSRPGRAACPHRGSGRGTRLHPAGDRRPSGLAFRLHQSDPPQSPEVNKIDLTPYSYSWFLPLSTGPPGGQTSRGIPRNAYLAAFHYTVRLPVMIPLEHPSGIICQRPGLLPVPDYCLTLGLESRSLDFRFEKYGFHQGVSQSQLSPFIFFAYSDASWENLSYDDWNNPALMGGQFCFAVSASCIILPNGWLAPKPPLYFQAKRPGGPHASPRSSLTLSA